MFSIPSRTIFIIILNANSNDFDSQIESVSFYIFYLQVHGHRQGNVIFIYINIELNILCFSSAWNLLLWFKSEAISSRQKLSVTTLDFTCRKLMLRPVESMENC